MLPETGDFLEYLAGDNAREAIMDQRICSMKIECLMEEFPPDKVPSEIRMALFDIEGCVRERVRERVLDEL